MTMRKDIGKKIFLRSNTRAPKIKQFGDNLVWKDTQLQHLSAVYILKWMGVDYKQINLVVVVIVIVVLIVITSWIDTRKKNQQDL